MWKDLPDRRPVAAAVIGWAVYSLSLTGWLLLPWDSVTDALEGWGTTLGVYLIRIVVTATLLTMWGLWGAAGFRTAPTWQRVVPALPLLLLPALPAIFGPGLVDRPPWKLAVLAFGVGTVAFGEEGMFRGVVMRVLLVRGVRSALFGSAAMFGLMHLVNLAIGSHPITVAAQVTMAMGIGIGFGAVALATGTIWPLLLIHFLMDFVNSVQAAAPVEDTGVQTTQLLADGGINVVLGLLTAGYGLWLLRRRGLLRPGQSAPSAKLMYPRSR